MKKNKFMKNSIKRRTVFHFSVSEIEKKKNVWYNIIDIQKKLGLKFILCSDLCEIGIF